MRLLGVLYELYASDSAVVNEASAGLDHWFGREIGLDTSDGNLFVSWTEQADATFSVSVRPKPHFLGDPDIRFDAGQTPHWKPLLGKEIEVTDVEFNLLKVASQDATVWIAVSPTQFQDAPSDSIAVLREP